MENINLTIKEYLEIAWIGFIGIISGTFIFTMIRLMGFFP